MVSAETACEVLHKALPRKRRGRGTGWLRRTRDGMPLSLVRGRTHWNRGFTTHWIRGFIAFWLARRTRTVMLMGSVRRTGCTGTAATAAHAAGKLIGRGTGRRG